MKNYQKKNSKNYSNQKTMNKTEKSFWENYKKETLEGIDLLLENDDKIAVGKLIFIAIESFGSFRLGRGIKDSPKKVLPGGAGRATRSAIINGFEYQKNQNAFSCFIKEYIKDFESDFFSQKNKIWENFRCGLIHDGKIKHNHKIVLKGPLINIQNKKITINFNELYDLLKNKSLLKFEQELNNKKFVLDRWRERYKFLNK